eukprot:62152-Pyramimonas_sp.AAC.1
MVQSVLNAYRRQLNTWWPDTLYSKVSRHKQRQQEAMLSGERRADFAPGLSQISRRVVVVVVVM